MIEVRRAVLSDARQIASVGRSSFATAFGYLFPEDVLTRYLEATYADKKIEGSLAKPNNYFFVAVDKETILGFLKLKSDCRHRLIPDPLQWQLQKIYVLPASTDKGIGTLLINFAEPTILEAAPDCCWLQVYAGNPRAQNLYRRVGYETIATDIHPIEHIPIPYALMKKTY